MAEKLCGKCGEMVDAAKAFCPGCGYALVTEEDREATSFDKMDQTVQFGQTMYNQMLSDMGLSVERESPYARAENEKVSSPNSPAQPSPGSEQKSNKTKWIIAAGVILVLGFLLLVAAAVLFYYFWPRIG